MDELNNLQAEIRELPGNGVLAIDDPSTLWTVESGSLAVFAVACRKDVPVGPRRYFFSAGPGDALFGLPASSAGERLGVIAVALENTTLRKVETRRAAELLGRARSTELAGRWMQRWAEALRGKLEKGDDGEPLEALPTFHANLVHRLGQLEDQEREDDRTRFEKRERLSRDVTREALGQLVSVLETGAEPAPQGPDLFVAAAMAARESGIALTAPPAWEEIGSTAEPVDRIARTSHVRTRRVLLHDSWWRQDCGPLLAFQGKERRPVALLPRTAGSYDVCDPATGTRTRVGPDEAAGLDPEAHMFYRPLPAQASHGIELIRFALRGRGRDLATILLTAGAATVLGMFTPQATALLVDYAIPDSDRALLMHIGLGLLAAALGGAVFRLSQGVAMMRLETGADAAAQPAVWDRLLNLQLSFFRRFSTGDLQSRVTAISQIRVYLSGTTLRSLFSSVLALMNLGLLLYYSRILTLVAVIVAAVSASVTLVSGVMILRCVRQTLELKGKFFGLIVQLIHGISKLRVAAAEERAFARWASEFARLLRLELRERRIQDSVQAINIGLTTLSAIVLFAIAAALIQEQGASLSTGSFLAFHVAYGTFIGAAVSLSNTVTDVLAIAILRERARPILETVPEVDDAKIDPGLLDGRMELDHVKFRYDAEGPVILDDVSLQIGAGQFVAFVGPSGSGKSTLFRMLLGFETPISGTILYDGQDLAGLDVHAIRRQMGVVLQAGRINAGSLYENIVCGANVSLNDAWEAARATGFADEIENMPMGMHTVISEGGTNLSGGQRQRLLLTRALVHKPRVLLLDEATSALDNKTQAIVRESLQRLHVTRVVIAHRLSTIRDADRIHVIDSGRIVQAGTFDELAGQEGLFARLIARQLT